MAAKHLIWHLFLFSLRIFVAANATEDRELTLDELKHLSDYEFKRLADFVRRKGRPFLSKLSLEELETASRNGNTQITDVFGGAADVSAVESSEQPNFNFNSDDSNVFHMGLPPMPVVAEVSTSRPLQPNERLVIPNILTPPPRLAKNDVARRVKGEQRTTTVRAVKLRTTTALPEMPTTTNEPLSFEKFQILAEALKILKNQSTKPQQSSTVAPAPALTTTTRPFRRQGRPLIVEQEEPEFQEFVVTSLSEKWKGLANEVAPRNRNQPVASPSPVPVSDAATFSISAPAAPALRRNTGNFGFSGVTVMPSKGGTSPAPSTAVPLSENLDRLESNDVNTEEQLAVVNALLSQLINNRLAQVKNKNDAEGTLPKGSYRVVKGLKTETAATVIPLPTTTTVSPIVPRGTKAYVTVLREGFMHDISPTEFSLVATITVIRDAGKVILVDTGLATDINGRTDMIQKLSKLNIAPPMVDIVVTTHGHADHAGNTNDFPDSIHYQGEFLHYRTKFTLNKLSNANSTQLTPNVKLLRTPGHTSDSISVVVSNTDQYGTVAIAGDTFFSEKDLDFPVLWKRFATDTRLQDDSRRKLICAANYIVPGHGKAFQVTASMKHGANCVSSGLSSRFHR